MIERMCRKCGVTFPQYSGLQTKCPRCTKGFKQATKPMNPKGKVAKNWDKDRAAWVKATNTGNDTWRCVIGGGRLTNNKLLMEYGYLPLEVDHEDARSRSPEDRRNPNKYQPMCHKHNTGKGSKTTAEYLSTSPDLQCG